jgi:hypothetical protein
VTLHPPTADEVVRAFTDRLHDVKIAVMHEFDVTERVYLQPILFYDMDMDWAALIRVLWHEGEDEDPNRPTVVDHIGLYSASERSGRVMRHAWHGDRRLFFDRSLDRARVIVEWWSQWFFALRQDDRAGWDPSPGLLVHNTSIERADRERARNLGLDLPYLAEMDVPCRFCRLPLHKDEPGWRNIWVDDTDGDGCMGDDNCINENQSHVPDITTSTP